MKIGFDTNIIVYAEGFDDGDKERLAASILRDLPVDRTVIPVQVLGELFNVLMRKAHRPPAMVERRIAKWADIGIVAETPHKVFERAVKLAVDHQLQIWDAVILATSEDVDCEILLSEDMRHGFQWRRITVVNPFIQPFHPLLTSAIASLR